MRENPGKEIVVAGSRRLHRKGSGSRQNVRQDVLDIDRALSDFDETGPRIARRRQRPDPALDAPAAGQLQRGRGPGFAGEPFGGDLRVRRQSVQVSISDISMAAELPPLAFRLLEPAWDGNVGQIGNPELVRPIGNHVLCQVGEDRAGMIAVRGDDVTPTPLGLETVLAHRRRSFLPFTTTP